MWIQTPSSLRWLVLGLLALQTGFIPAVEMACACSGDAACCVANSTEPTATEPTATESTADSHAATCCCESGCCQVSPAAEHASCCHALTAITRPVAQQGCSCCAAPQGPAKSTAPRTTTEKEVAPAMPLWLMAQLPAVVPSLDDGVQQPLFGSPARGPSVQIAFCVWRN